MYQTPGDTDFSFTFTHVENDFTQSLIVNNSGHDSEWKRKANIDLSQINLQDYIGTFYSKDLDTTLDIYYKDDQLYIRMKYREIGKLNLDGIDLFTTGYAEIIFDRENKEVTGFKMNSQGAKNLRFNKL